MTYQIDQSGKIENTAKDTILCLANGTWVLVCISGRVKRSLQEVFRRHGQPRNFVLFTFVAGLAVLIKRGGKIGRVVIDKEYPGKEPIIKNLLEKMLMGSKTDLVIEFGLVGKHSRAHLLAKERATKKRNTSFNLKEKDILAELKKTEVEKRQKNA